MLNSIVQEIKSRLDIVDIIQEYIPLKPAGAHNLKALCPFHNEKTPSFMISRDKQIWHCFGCSKGGDIFTFVQEYEGMSFPEALRHFANRAGVKLVCQNQKIANQKTRLLDLLNLTCRFYQEYLVKKPEAEIARKYLIQRGIEQRMVNRFKIGYSPDSWENTKKFLRQNGYTKQEIASAGLLVRNESKGTFYDRFRGRLIFPIFDHNDAIVGFGARTLPSAQTPTRPETTTQAKYINSPQTLIYDKSRIVYGLNFAKQEIKKRDLTVVVEGYMDVISSHQVGITNVVACSGTALTEQQLLLLKRYSNRIALSFDTDMAGENATQRGIEIALALGMEILVITLPIGKDPDECIKDNLDNWKKAIESAEEFVQYSFNKIFAKFNINKVGDKKAAAKILLTIIKKINDKIEQSFWLKKLADKFDVEESILRDVLNGIKLPKTNITTLSNIYQANHSLSNSNMSVKTREERLSEKLLAAILIQPPILEIANQHLMPEMLTGKTNQDLYKQLIIYYTETDNLAKKGINNFNNFLANSGDKTLFQLKKILELLAAKEFDEINEDEIKKEALNYIDNLKNSYIVNKRRELQKAMQEAEERGDAGLIEKLTEEFGKLM